MLEVSSNTLTWMKILVVACVAGLFLSFRFEPDILMPTIAGLGLAVSFELVLQSSRRDFSGSLLVYVGIGICAGVLLAIARDAGLSI